MKKWALALTITVIIVIFLIGCEKDVNKLKHEDFEINTAKWDPEIEFDCSQCDKPICRWEMAWELEYVFNPRNGLEKALCLFYVDDKVKIKELTEKNNMKEGIGILSDYEIPLDCWRDYKVGVCCAYTVDELVNDEYVCKQVFLEALCP